MTSAASRSAPASAASVAQDVEEARCVVTEPRDCRRGRSGREAPGLAHEQAGIGDQAGEGLAQAGVETGHEKRDMVGGVDVADGDGRPAVAGERAGVEDEQLYDDAGPAARVPSGSSAVDLAPDGQAVLQRAPLGVIERPLAAQSREQVVEHPLVRAAAHPCGQTVEVADRRR